ncbi:MAG: DUF4242 domain-containing protein [Gammaproteobacteria bacterium]|nr:DUF4242 domain-containing protein [Gammaproteobacteria bacterium]
MDTFIIRRRNAWKNGDELKAIADKSLKIGNEDMPDKIRWIRSYVITEEDGTLGTLCIYQATSADAITEHAKAVGMPADEISHVMDTVVVREDPKKIDQAA